MKSPWTPHHLTIKSLSKKASQDPPNEAGAPSAPPGPLFLAKQVGFLGETLGGFHGKTMGLWWIDRDIMMVNIPNYDG